MICKKGLRIRIAVVSIVVATSAAAEQVRLVRLLVAPGSWFAGKIEVEALLIDPAIHEIAFLIDGQTVERLRRPPWRTKLRFADPPEEHLLEVVAFSGNGRELARDGVEVNRRSIPFRVHIAELRPSPDRASIELEAKVSVPRGGVLDRVEISLGDSAPITLVEAPFTARLEAPALTPEDFVRAVAYLDDGNSTEDVRLVAAVGVSDAIDVNVVQLQVLVTGRNGVPAASLNRHDFVVRQGREEQKIDSFAVAPEVPLMLGLVLDSSGSMAPMWPRTLEAARLFLDQTLGPRDQSFLVDFDESVRLLSPPTGNVDLLEESLAAIQPSGGTALFDSIAFSLLQFSQIPGRRALVVITDGFDSGSAIDGKRTVELGTALGVPIYVVALPSEMMRSRSTAMTASSIIHLLKLMTDPTGGRLLRLGGGGGLQRAFAQIAAELRRQYILTYSTDELPDGTKHRVDVSVPGRKDLEVRAVFGLDQIL